MALTSKQRAYLKSLAMTEPAILYIGKNEVTLETVASVEEALAKRELIKIGIQKNCEDDARTVAETLSERTSSEIVQIIGRKIVLYRPAKGEKRKIVLPRRNDV